MKKTEYLKKVYSNPNSENISELISYLTTISKKELKLKLIRQYLFKTSWIKKDDNLMARCHLKSASKYFQYLLDSQIEYSKEQIQIVIADLNDYIPIFDDNEDVSFILMSTNVLPSTIHFKISEELFYKHDIDKTRKNNYSLDLLTIYNLRLSLEKRILGLMGIDYATNNSHTIGLNKLIKIVKTFKTVKYSDKIDWDEIELVNKWINHHIHRQLRPYPWVIHQAFEILKPLINPKEPIEIGTRKLYSFYSATLVENENEFENEVLEKLKFEYPEIKIKWKLQREIPRIKN